MWKQTGRLECPSRGVACAVTARLVILLNCAVVGAADQADEGSGLPAGVYEAPARVDPRPGIAAVPAPLPKSLRLLAANDTIAELRLPPLDMEFLAAQDAESARFDKMKRFGVERLLDVNARTGEWLDLPDGGRVWVLDIVAEGAEGVRLHFANARISKGDSLLIFAPEDAAQVSGPYVGRGPAANGEFWAGSLFTQRVRVEYHLPANRVANSENLPFGESDELPFELDSLQHYYRNPFVVPLGGAGDCHNDVTCQPDFATAARAVGRMAFVSGTGSSACTGQLISNDAGDFAPLFLTARHCIKTNAEATSLEVFWLFQTATCNGPPPSLNSVPRTAGSILLSTGGGGADVTLLRLTGTVPSGLTYLGWSTSVPDGTQSVCIHHPAGEFKRISFGNRAALTVPCDTAGTNPVRVQWTDGPTEQGSSGSGILKRDGLQLFGVLSCGPSSCGSETEDFFGSFAVAHPSLAPFLAAGGNGGAAPANDNCANAIEFGASTSVQGTNLNATDDGTSTCASTRDVWWRYVPAAGGMVAFDTVASNFDTTLTVLTACGGTELACNDDVSQGTLTSRVQFIAVAGTAYLVRVAGYQGAAGSIVLNVTGPGDGQPPVNDTCASSIGIAAASIQGSTANATNGGIAECAGTADAWWRFTAATSGVATLDTVGSNFDTTLAVFSSCGGASLACNDDVAQGTLTSRVQLNVVVGTTYLVRIAGFNGATGNVTINLAVAGANGNTNANTGGNANVNSGGNANVNSGGNANVNSGGNVNANTGTNLNSNGVANGNRNSGGNTNTNSNGNGSGPPVCGFCPFGGFLLVTLSYAGLIVVTRSRRRCRR